MSTYINNTGENNQDHSCLLVDTFSVVSIFRDMINKIIVADFPVISDLY